MTADPNPFIGPDPARLDAIAARAAEAIRQGCADLARELMVDATLHPAIITAAFAKAYTVNLLSTVRSAGGDTDQLLASIFLYMRAELAKTAGA